MARLISSHNNSGPTSCPHFRALSSKLYLIMLKPIAYLGDVCKGVRSFGPEAVFAVHYKIWKAFFTPAYYDTVMEALMNR